MNTIPISTTDSLSGWTCPNPSLVTVATDESIRSIKISAEPSAADGTESTYIWQPIDIKKFDKNGEYRLKFRARSDHFPQEYNVYIGFLQGESVAAAVGYEWRQVGAAWQDVRLDFRDVNTIMSSAKIQMQVKAPGSVWISDLQIEQLPPGTIGAEERQLKDLPQYKGAASGVQISSDHRFMHGGKPFFPIGMWGIDYPSESVMDTLASYGFNVTGTGHLYERGPEGVKQFLDQLHKRGLKAIGVLRYAVSHDTPNLADEAKRLTAAYAPIMDVTRIHPAFFAYDIGDEVAWAGNDIATFCAGAHSIRQHDPNHPVFSNAAPRGSIASLRRYYRFVDVGGSDIYPWWDGGEDRHSDLPNKTLSVVGDETVKNLQALGGKKPVMMTLQAFGWSDGTTDEALKAKNYQYPPLNVLRYMAFDAIVNGATGILMFQDQRYHDAGGTYIKAKIKPIAQELRAMHDVLAAQTVADALSCSDERVKLITKRYGNKLTVIAVNRSAKPISCVFTINRGSNVWYLKEPKKKMTIQRKRFAAQFDAWGVLCFESV